MCSDREILAKCECALINIIDICGGRPPLLKLPEEHVDLILSRLLSQNKKKKDFRREK